MRYNAEYIDFGELGQKVMAARHTAVCIQNVDGLKISAYLLDTALRHIM